MSLKNWQVSLQPREKALSLGIDKLSDSELLALILRSGNKGQSCIALANEILNQCQGFCGLYQKSIKELMDIKGVGCSKACEIMATLEIVKRINYQAINTKESLSNSKAIFNWLKLHIGINDNEYMIVIFLDTKNRVIGYQDLFIGDSVSVDIDAKLIFNSAIKNKAAKIVIAHNHPSQSANPSFYDDVSTANLIEAGKLIGIPVVDHLIICYDKYYSYKEKRNEIL